MINKRMTTLTELDSAILNKNNSNYVHKLLSELKEHKSTISRIAKLGSNSTSDMNAIYALQEAIDCAERILTIKL